MSGPWEQYAPQPAAAADGPWSQYAPPAPLPPVTTHDRVQAGEAGFLKGTAYLAGMFPDVIPNVAGLGTAGYDAFQHYVRGIDWADLPRPPQPNSVSKAITHIMDKWEPTSTQINRPDDPASRYISTAASVIPGALAGGGNVLQTTASAIPPALAGQAVAEGKPFKSDMANQTAAILAQALVGAAMPRGRVDSPGASVSNQTVRDAQDIDLVIPPATTNNTIVNRLVESIAGKRNVEQRAQVINTEGANQAARTDMGIGGEGQITAGEIAKVRAAAAPAYTAMRQAGPIQTGSDPAFVQTLNQTQARFAGASNVLSHSGAEDLARDIADISSQPTHNASDLLDTVSVLRDRASQAFRAGDNGKGAAYRQVSDAIEQQIDNSLTQQNGGVPTPVVQNYRDARRSLAIAHTVEDARNEGSGNISGAKLAAMLNSGAPLSDNLETVARAANVAKRAFAEPTHSAGVNHLGLWGTILGGVALGHEAMPGGLGMAVGAVPGGLALAREGASRYALGPGQRNAVATQRAPIDPRVLAAGLNATRANQ